MGELHVTSEIGTLKTVMLHRPGEELLNLTPARLPELLFDDIPYLEVAQMEHDVFAELLRSQGVEVLYLEQLAAEALDSEPGLRDAFTNDWLAESGLTDEPLIECVRAYLNAIPDTLDFVCKCIAGVRRSEVELPLPPTNLLTDLVRTEQHEINELLVDPMPNAYFTRDPFAVAGGGVLMNRMLTRTRRRETLLAKYIFRLHPRFKGSPLFYHREAAFHIEGGDVLVLNDHTLAIGISQRTQASAIDMAAQNLFWGEPFSGFTTIYAFHIPASRAFMHLDTVFTQIDADKFTIHPGIMGQLQVFEMTRGAKPGQVNIAEMNDTLDHVLARALGLDGVQLIPCGGGDATAAAREQWNDGSNTLAVAPGKICVYARNSVTNDVLYKAGLDLIVMPSAELSRGRGGPRCMSMPFVREEV